MIRLLIRAGISLLANAIGLLIASALLDDMEVSGAAFVVAVVIFTVVEVLVEPLLRQMAVRNVPALLGSIALVTTLLGLIITSLISSGLDIEGVATWLLATIIVWAVVLVAGIVLPIFFLKEVVEEQRD